MKKFISTFLFLFLIFIIQFSFYRNANFEKYYTGDEDTDSDQSGNTNDIENTCICDIDRNSCDYLCCCDTSCPNEAIEDWRKHHKCIDEKDSLGIFADRCIDIHLVLKNNTRRGLKIEKQTEDISKSEETIENYCYSMDNSGKMKKSIVSLNELGKEKYKEFNEFNNIIKDDIYKYYIKEIIFKNFNDKSISSDLENEKNFINIKETSKFDRNGKFSLLSGTNCENINNVEILKPENYSCYTNEPILSSDIINIKFNEEKCENKVYNLENGILRFKAEERFKCENSIREVEFILFLDSSKYNSKIYKCKINIVCEINKEGGNYMFKNSVIFNDKNNFEKEIFIPYRFSGQGGYTNNSPLKIFNGNYVFNEFYISGRNKGGDCNIKLEKDENIYDYLYDFDVPLSFKKDYIYSCKLNSNTNLEKTILYSKIDNITKIASYGSSSYNNINNSQEWITPIKNLTNLKNYKYSDNAYIDMNIYIKTKKIGFYSHKYIDSVEITGFTESNKEGIFQFKVKFYDLSGDNSNEQIYANKPDYPAFIPRIPGDILDPMIYSDVDK